MLRGFLNGAIELTAFDFTPVLSKYSLLSFEKDSTTEVNMTFDKSRELPGSVSGPNISEVF